MSFLLVYVLNKIFRVHYYYYRLSVARALYVAYSIGTNNKTIRPLKPPLKLAGNKQ